MVWKEKVRESENYKSDDQPWTEERKKKMEEKLQKVFTETRREESTERPRGNYATEYTTYQPCCRDHATTCIEQFQAENERWQTHELSKVSRSHGEGKEESR